MPEVKRPVKTVEVNYVCDACGHGMMEQRGESNLVTGENLHACVICGHEQVFKWVTYPRIAYVGEEESI
jgi:predicted SprT family Zn-dependent metalloprotease